ncbi:cobalt-precorrin-5B (C(1))-methyltransferase [Saccharopolyspora flava]|uniref:Cobalt-precorrin-5B C(1)-methyltransferase n=1 Tax=Saccharopolyspora flava TaxID=95161 RepID=A0A1I6P4K7_9PSEU|nr:cobalt-precorrin-5B (C(1))-methyltransferase [Saccharopolyspora flava]SFS35102.1 cobalt-precorrin-5B (C1)-methyltransferase [Saccharopolyspora flava]
MSSQSDPQPPLREPDLPRTAKVRPKALRTGFTTGACSAAAARAAAELLVTGELPATVDIGFPDGKRRRFPVDSGSAEPATAVVVKDAGDDPDVTHGARLTVSVTSREDGEVVLHGGEGVGTVTKPGLGLEVGGPAINPVPRRMITDSVREVLGDRGADVTITVPGGEKMAYKTTNRRLGIFGGISILGTTGIVRPFSTASWRSSVEQAVSVLSAQDGKVAVLSTGGRTERVAMRLLPDEPEVAFIEVGDFTGAAVRRAVEHGLDEVVFVGMIGKLTKLASGVVMTHYTRSKVDTGLLGRLTAEFGGSEQDVAEVTEAATARRAYEVWQRGDHFSACAHRLCELVAAVLERFSEECGRRLRVRVAMVDFEGEHVVAATEARWVTWQSR